jgi:hypothetical protein
LPGFFQRGLLAEDIFQPGALFAQFAVRLAAGEPTNLFQTAFQEGGAAALHHAAIGIGQLGDPLVSAVVCFSQRISMRRCTCGSGW